MASDEIELLAVSPGEQPELVGESRPCEGPERQKQGDLSSPRFSPISGAPL